MRIVESRIRSIIREEARRVLRESESGTAGGVSKEQVEAEFKGLALRNMSILQVRQILTQYEEAVAGSSELAEFYPGFSQDNFKDLIRLVLNEVGVNNHTIEILDSNVEFDG